MRPFPDATVSRWLKKQSIQHLYTTWINIAEIQRGLDRLPNGKRKEALKLSFIGFVTHAFSSRVLSFDQQSARNYAALSTKREQAGYHVDPVDMMIAATAQSRSFAVATRNTADFTCCGIELINPWDLEIIRKP
ncbi:type II toxin-antitoxin system VapC family toxin [Ningiella sp. W23]|uniref:type II toxin-antitoxin system VapC family toxin n=1 Tax=Ningiella sp. W23 TaxID=3023715 RepID=UPI00375687B0